MSRQKSVTATVLPPAPAPEKNEKPHQREAFEMYCRLGPERSLALLAERLGIEKRVLERWSALFGWRIRVKSHDERISSQVKFESADELYEHKNRAILVVKAQLIELEKSILRDEDGKIIGWKGRLIDPSYVVEIEKAIEKLKRDELDPLPQEKGGGGTGDGKGVAIQINITKD